MTQIVVSGLSQKIDSKIKLNLASKGTNIGTVFTIADGIARVKGLRDVQAGEMVFFGFTLFNKDIISSYKDLHTDNTNFKLIKNFIFTLESG